MLHGLGVRRDRQRARHRQPGEIEITTYDDAGIKTGQLTNKSQVVIDGTAHPQEMPYGAFN